MSEKEQGPGRLEVVLAVNGVFHHFDLGRELDRRGMLKRIYSGFPWARLKREGIAREKVSVFPWILTPQFLVRRQLGLPASVDRQISRWMVKSFDWWIARTMPRCDAFVALSGSGVKSGARAQAMGAKHICDRGSAHIRYQDRILREEYARWGVERDVIVDPLWMAREENEYAQSDAITVPSEFARRSFVEMGVPGEKLRKIPYGVRMERFRRVGQPPKDRFEVLFVGAMSLEKGVPHLVEAFAQVRHPRKRLRMVGASRKETRKVLARLPQEGVEILGLAPQAELPAMMSSSHVLVLPSIQDGFGMVMNQAMACGCPVIASTNSGGPDLIDEGVNGFVVPIRSPEAIAERLQQLADDPALQQRMSEAAIQRVQHVGGWAEYGEAWVKLLSELCGDPRAGGQSRSSTRG